MKEKKIKEKRVKEKKVRKKSKLRADTVLHSNNKVLRWIVDIVLVILGAGLYSVGLHCFATPNDIASGGVGGISIIISELIGHNIVGILYGAINVPLIIIGLIFLGKKMMIKTVISVAVITAATDYLLPYLNVPVYSEGDKILAALFGGIFFGVGMGLVYLREGTTGGTDIINKLINRKFPHFSMGVIMMATDAVVIMTSMVVFRSIEAGLYSIISIFVASKVMDVILYGSFEGKMLLIFSDRYETITEFIMNSLERGVTLLDGEGGYSRAEKHVICCAVHKNEYSKVKRKVKEIDPNAFIIITNAGEVLGMGFHDNA
ncbi:MAG: YitT family protein [Oscillospiraceae bacterium]|nr:YitT family protein [Oscillospiraceae bacterium]